MAAKFAKGDGSLSSSRSSSFLSQPSHPQGSSSFGSYQSRPPSFVKEELSAQNGSEVTRVPQLDWGVDMSLAPVFSSKSVFPSLLHIKQLTENDHCTVAAEGPWLGHSGYCPWAAGNSIQFAGNLVPSERILLSSLHYQWSPQCLYFHEKKLRESNYFRRPDLDEIMLKLRHSTNVLGAFHEQGLEMKP